MSIAQTYNEHNMGRWKIHKLMKLGRASRTRSGMARTYLAIPPEDGWKGGAPEANGYKRGARK